MNKTAKTVSIGPTLQSCPCHACAFFTSKEEEYRVMLPFMAEGFEAGDKLVHIIDKNHRAERAARLNEAGIDVETAEQNGQLELLPWEQAHVVDGYFDSIACLRTSTGDSPRTVSVIGLHAFGRIRNGPFRTSRV